MSMSRCGNICIMLHKCSRKERRRGFRNRSSVDAAVPGRRCVFLCERKNTVFGLPKVDAIRNHWLRLFTTQQHNPNIQMCAMHFMDDSFVNLVEYKAGYAWRLFLNKRVNFRLCYNNLALLNQRNENLFLWQVYTLNNTLTTGKNIININYNIHIYENSPDLLFSITN